MNLIVFGSTGMVGRQLIQQALFKDHKVKAFGRNVYTTDFLQSDNLQLVQGALFSEREVFHALEGCDAVVSAIGGGSDGSDKTRTLGLKNIIQQMEKTGVKRIIGIGGQGILDASERIMVMDEKSFPPEQKAVSLEHLKAYNYLHASTLDWTFVCPAKIINEGPTGSFKTAIDTPPQPNNGIINVGDLAMFMMNELERNEFVRHRVGISN